MLPATRRSYFFTAQPLLKLISLNPGSKRLIFEDVWNDGMSPIHPYQFVYVPRLPRRRLSGRRHCGNPTTLRLKRSITTAPYNQPPVVHGEVKSFGKGSLGVAFSAASAASDAWICASASSTRACTDSAEPYLCNEDLRNPVGSYRAKAWHRSEESESGSGTRTLHYGI